MSATPPPPLDQIVPDQFAPSGNPVPQLLVAHLGTPRARLLALVLVLFVSFAHFILSSAYFQMTATLQGDPRQLRVRLLSALIAEAGSLAVLWYVLFAQGRGWKNIGWNFAWLDILRGVGLVVGSTIAMYVIWIPLQLAYRSYSGHYLTPKPIHGMLGVGVTTLSIAFVCLNPFFEELIVRGYLMSEISALGGSGLLAILISIAVQMSYHLYQGFARAIALVITFAVFSIYFWKTRRIAPVVIAHLCIDAYALVRGSF
jgi:membrane protease YdiL (CAAX protease family)